MTTTTEAPKPQTAAQKAAIGATPAVANQSIAETRGQNLLRRLRREHIAILVAGSVMFGALVWRMWPQGEANHNSPNAPSVDEGHETGQEPVAPHQEKEQSSQKPEEGREIEAAKTVVPTYVEIPALAAADALFRARRFNDARKSYAAFLLIPNTGAIDPTDHLAWARARHALCLGQVAVDSLGAITLSEPRLRFEEVSR